MGASTPAGIITAISTVFIALGGVITAITVLLPIMRVTKQTHDVTEQTHIIVNSQRTEMVARIDSLVEALHNAGIAVPAKTPLVNEQSTGTGESE